MIQSGEDYKYKYNLTLQQNTCVEFWSIILGYWLCLKDFVWRFIHGLHVLFVLSLFIALKVYE